MDDKQREEFAERLYKFYINKIGPRRKTKARAISNILKHSQRYPFKNMAKAVLHYSTEVMGCESRFRRDPANFFNLDDEPFFVNYLPGVFDPERLHRNDPGCQALPEILTAERLAELNS